MAIVKPEMKSYVWLRTVDGLIQEVEKEVIMFCPLIRDEISKTGMGYSKTCPISLPEYVKPAGLGLLLDYCRFHCIRGHSTKECKTFDEQFIRMDKHKLLQLTCAADALQLDALVRLCSKEFTRVVAGKTPEQINEIFGLPDDQTEVEKLAPLELEDFVVGHRVRLQNRLNARKREQSEDRQKLMNVEVEGETIDERSVDDLLSFINGANRVGTKGTKANKKKNKNRRKKGNAKDPSTNENENFNEESSPLLECHNVNSDIVLESSSSKNLRVQDLSPVKFSSPDPDFIDDDLDDDLDPAWKEKVDREVMDFERILNMTLSERLRSFDHDSRPVSCLVKGDGSTHSNTLSN